MGKQQDAGVEMASAEDNPDAVAADVDSISDVKEHLRRDLARVRAKFSMDAVPGERSFTRAWMSDRPIEEYEAEFVDTMADCLGAGLSLGDALTCWDSGDLASDPADGSDGMLADDEPASVSPVVPRRPTGGHRVFIR